MYMYLCMYFVVGENLNAFIGVIIFRPNKRFGYNHHVARSRAARLQQQKVRYILIAIKN